MRTIATLLSIAVLAPGLSCTFSAGGPGTQSQVDDTKWNHRKVMKRLRQIQYANIDFKVKQDPQGSGSYWVADVSGLYRVTRKDGRPICLIENDLAGADAVPVPEGKGVSRKTVNVPAPISGYLFRVLEEYEIEPGQFRKYDEGSGRNKDRFAVCAFPVNHVKTGALTFVLNEAGSIWWKDIGGEHVPRFAIDMAAQGWKDVESESPPLPTPDLVARRKFEEWAERLAEEADKLEEQKQYSKAMAVWKNIMDDLAKVDELNQDYLVGWKDKASLKLKLLEIKQNPEPTLRKLQQFVADATKLLEKFAPEDAQRLLENNKWVLEVYMGEAAEARGLYEKLRNRIVRYQLEKRKDR
jgi:hypothetical protein